MQYAVQHALNLRALGIQVSYSGIPKAAVDLVFKAALGVRFQQPTASTIIQLTGTTLDMPIVSTILEGALRLVPVDDSPEGTRVRKLKEAQKAMRSAAAELRFVEHVRSVWPDMQDESEQRQRIKQAIDRGETPMKSTPDVLFENAIDIAGSSCKWIEYKDSFAFKKNPMLHTRQLKQFKKYVEAFGPGVVVYKHGFEHDIFNIVGVRCWREAEALQLVAGA